MKPLVLEMQGLGPYGKKVVVDFTQFGNGGLYLVTGETGSGKTFIFDAICYALYGEVSGGERKTEMLRTMGLDGNVETYVKLKFECGGKEYEIMRKPAYERAKKRGAGTVTDNARVEFVTAEGTYTRIEDVNDRIKELIGLNAEQFKQIVMIAQGKFAQILQKSTKERRELLREIFNTNAYISLELRVKDEYNRLGQEYEARKREINDKIEEITASDEEYREELEQLRQEEFVNLDRVLELLAIFDKKDGELLTIYNEKLDALQKQQVGIKLALDKANLRARQEKDLAQLQKRKEEVDRIAVTAKEDAGRVTEALEFFATNREQQVTANTNLVALRNLYQLGLDNDHAEVELQKTDADRQQATKNALEQQNKYSNVYQSFLLAQSGILASTLKPGVPCPVCGSVEHPSPAQLSGAAPTEEMVNHAKAVAEKAEALRHQLQGRYESAQKAQKLALEKFLAMSKEYYQEEFAPEKATALVERIKDDGTKLKEELQQLAGAESNKKKEFGMLANESVEQYQKRIQERAAKAREEVANVAGAIKSLQEAMAQLDIGENIEDLQKRMSDNQKELNALKSENEKVLARRALNGGNAKSIEAKRGAMLKIEEERNDIDNLYRTLSGNLNKSNAVKVSFETYMQQSYFDRILAYANNRLLKISHGRYRLVRRSDSDAKGNAKVGLDLNVHDAHNGKERSANSLSGGETFMASLALALGMADEVQASAGGIHIETMFIDEGFGSLSKDFLNTTVDVLNTLADNKHLVGIISHVEELKERIEQQILVTRNQDGHSSIEVVA